MNSLRALPAARILRALARAAERWCDADFPPRARTAAAIGTRTGYSPPVVEVALDRLFGKITEAALERTIASELGALAALDDFVPRTGRPALHARGVERVGIIASDTTIGVAIAPLIFALCAKCLVTVKDRSDALVSAFAAVLSDEEPAFAEAIDAGAWDGPTAGLGRIAEADVVVAFGGDAALRAVRDALAPQTRFIAYGRRLSAAYFPRERLTPANEAETALDLAGAATDALLYDGSGCLSLRLCFAEATERELPAFADRLRTALDAAARKFPRGNGPLPAAFVALRERLRFRASVYGETAPARDAEHLAVVLAHEDTPLLPGRTVGIVGVASPAEALAYLQAHRLPLEALAYAGPSPRADLLHSFAAGGVARICRVGNLQDPPITGEHGAIARISHFVRRVNLTA